MAWMSSKPLGSHPDGPEGPQVPKNPSNTAVLCLDPYPTDVGWVGDALTSHGIGVLVGSRWARFRLTRDPPQDQPGNWIAWLETVAIRLGLLMLLDIGASPGKVSIVHTDNTTTQDAIEQRKSRDPLVNREWKAIQNLLLTAEIDIQARRVSSGENRADSLSRGHDGNHRLKNKMRVHLPVNLRCFLVQT
ncbi:hypothetical protein PSTG_15978 [Puccinia striiformis f. sp. tritici PST-78]|uniref:RNase H type-1 domain-containing protein n=1 Tax=Puccinia striiformis f. sp. tritici PST-78 TaxID=1165861 RepID=A0A0L0UU89_9BASI|nr:hypothetical protein PSTG_15978 [Puccinia striiformis f. sp. tritici PST-78]